MKKVQNAITKWSKYYEVKFKACTKSDTQLNFFLHKSFFFKPQINPTAGSFIESSACEKSQCLLA